jgi:hypothetical protein
MNTPSEEQNVRPDRSHPERDATWASLEHKEQLAELWTHPPKILGSLEQDPRADAWIDELTYDDLRKFAEDPEITARFEQLRAASEARMKKVADAYVALRHTLTARTTPHDREQQQAVTPQPQHPGHSPRR